MGNRCFRSGKWFRQNKGKTGFTLLEVLVALLIIGISLGVVLQAFSQSKRISWKADEKIERVRIAQNLFANSELVDSALGKGKKEGNVPGEEGWHYSMHVEPLQLGAADDGSAITVPSMMNLQLSLVHRVGKKEKTFTISRWYRF